MSKALIDAANNEVTTYGVTLLRSLGMTPQQIAGVMGSVAQESGLDPNAFNPAGGGDGAYGLVQYRGARLDSLKAFADEKGVTIDDGFTQWEHVVQELLSTEGKALERVKAAATSGEASEAWTKYFERPGLNEYHSDRRAGYADIIGQSWGVNMATDETRATQDLAKFDEQVGQKLAQSGTGSSDSGDPADRPGAARTSQTGGDGILDSVNGLFSNPDGGGTFTQAGSAIGGMIGGAPGLVVGGMLGKFADGLRKDEGDGFGGFLDGVGDTLDGIDSALNAPDKKKTSTTTTKTTTPTQSSSNSGSNTSSTNAQSSSGGGFLSSVNNAIDSAISSVAGIFS